MTTTETTELTTSEHEEASTNTPGKTGKLKRIKDLVGDEIKHRPRPMSEQIPTGRDLIEYSRSGAWTLDPPDSTRRKLHSFYSRYVAVPIIATCVYVACIALYPERAGAVLATLALIGGGIALYIFL